MTERGRRALRWTVAGGGAFWLPVVLLFAMFGGDPSLIVVNCAPVGGLIVLAIVARLRERIMPRWGWVLVGIYVLGPTAILLASHIPPPPSETWSRFDVLLAVGICLFPPMTLWLATLGGFVIPVLLATVALPILADLQVTKERRNEVPDGRGLT